MTHKISSREMKNSLYEDPIEVKISDESYLVVLGKGITSTAAVWNPEVPRKAFIVADRKVLKSMKVLSKKLAQSGWDVYEYVVTGGESLKQMEKVSSLHGKLLKDGVDRSSVIFALGGGSVGDTAGFVAATILRGISWIGIPTTLLSQVDSSVGGKTGVNHARGKNLIGAFHQPSLVICDIDHLKTLSDRDRVAGLGEMLKIAVAFDASFFDQIEKNWEKILSLHSETVLEAIRQSVCWKVEAVASDEKDLLGRREKLNLGHTFGHALEALTLYKTYRHGEAVLYGIAFAALLSLRRGMISPEDCHRIITLIQKIPLPALPQKMSAIRIVSLMKRDKKASGGRLKFVLNEEIGSVVSVFPVKPDEVCEVVKDLIELFPQKKRRRKV